jgi:hypothetical protein
MVKASGCSPDGTCDSPRRPSLPSPVLSTQAPLPPLTGIILNSTDSMTMSDQAACEPASETPAPSTRIRAPGSAILARRGVRLVRVVARLRR